MVSPKDQKKATKALTIGNKLENNEPEWASGLKRLYDSVLDEPLPDSLVALLAKLDEADRK